MNFPHTFLVFAYLAAKHQIWLTVNSGYVVTSFISPGPQPQSTFWYDVPSGMNVVRGRYSSRSFFPNAPNICPLYASTPGWSKGFTPRTDAEIKQAYSKK
jgi:hypothetical protein